jgi:hypothetical protein
MKGAAPVRADRKKDKLAERYRPVGIAAVSAAAEYQRKPMKDKEHAAAPVPGRAKRARKRNGDN